MSIYFWVIAVLSLLFALSHITSVMMYKASDLEIPWTKYAWSCGMAFAWLLLTGFSFYFMTVV